MIVFDLSCSDGHCFEGWFSNTDDYIHQLKSGLLTCPQCGSQHITKKPSASRINLNKQATPSNATTSTEEHFIKKAQQFIEKNFDDVGSEFKSEALKMHYGEKERRNIKGLATIKEAVELQQEGIDIYPIPGEYKQKLN